MLSAKSLTTATLEKIAAALGVPLWQLFASPTEVAQSLGGVDAAADGVVRCPHCGKRYKLVPLDD